MRVPRLTDAARDDRRCPHCGARGVRIADRRLTEGVELVFDYCGHCGKNAPRERPPARDTNVIAMPKRQPK